MKLGVQVLPGRPRPWPHCVRWGPSYPALKGAQPPNFRPISAATNCLHGSRCHIVWRQASTRRLCVRWGPRSPPQKEGGAPKFSAHVYYGQMAEWIKMALRMEVGLSSGDFMLDEEPAPSPKRGRNPQIFGPCLLRPKGCMDQDATWY